jgi:dynein heavy chain
MEDALRSAVRRSLAELARLLAGDKRAEVAPLFTVALALERTNRIELRPTVQARPARRRRQ